MVRYLFNNLRNRARLGSKERNERTERGAAGKRETPFEGYERDIPRTAEKKANYMSAGRQQKARRARAAPAQNEHRLRLANIESRTARRVCTSFVPRAVAAQKGMWIKSTKLWPLTLPPTVTEDRPQIDDPPTSLPRPNERTRYATTTPR